MIAGVILLAEVGAAGYLALVTWLISGWPVDDSVAFRMTSGAWYVEGAKRALVSGGIALTFGVVTYFVSSRWVSPAMPSLPQSARLSAVGLATCVLLAGIVGAVHLVVTRPFL